MRVRLHPDSELPTDVKTVLIAQADDELVCFIPGEGGGGAPGSLYEICDAGLVAVLDRENEVP